MTADQKEGMVSIIGSAYFQPISDLLEKLFQRPAGQNLNPVQVGSMENGYSVSICVLAVLCLESYLMRVRYINRKHPSSQKKNVLDFLEDLYPSFPSLEALTETFVLRDLLAHNHLWVIEFLWDEESGMKLLGAMKDSVSGDRKYKEHVDIVNRKTKLLELNVLPTRVSRKDVGKVLRTIWDALIYIEKQNRNQCYISHLAARFQGKHIRFGELISDIHKECMSTYQST